MKLLEYAKSVGLDEIEVWDSEVDTQLPYYLMDRDHTWEDNDEEHYLHLLESWLFGLEVKHPRGEVVCVNVWQEIENHWDALKNDYDYSVDDDDDEVKCDCVDNVFIALSQGYYSFAKRFCHQLGIE